MDRYSYQAAAESILEIEYCSRSVCPLPCVPYLMARRKGKISFYPDVPSILQQLRQLNILVGVASRTDTPDLARKALGLLKLPPNGETAHSFFDHLEIYPGETA